MNPSFFPLTIHTAAVISRDKLNGGGRHFGVHFPGGEVVDFHPAGVRYTTIQGFLEGRACKVERLIPAEEVRQAHWRARTAPGQVRPYHLLDFNCEHFANFIAGAARPESAQITGLAVLGLVGLVCALFSS
ncbi:lecithin retinol acyltransferase family protein [Rhodoferax sediminis]|uniref:LRAT domain-containing protein n=1 Tax=Rhodoferax aquaticus TaxID=2527691 RepID=A0A515EUS2_9BURK|nr:hypothetical protein EXZ61_21000 [Rhodoferax aquaticus]